MKKMLLTLSACAVFLSGCSTPQSPTVSTDSIQSVLVVPMMSGDQSKQELLQAIQSKTANALKKKGYGVSSGSVLSTGLDSSSLEKLAQQTGTDAILLARLEGVQSNYAVLGTYSKVSMHYRLYDKNGDLLIEKTYKADSLPNSQADDWKVALVADVIASAYYKAKPPYEQLLDEVSEKFVKNLPNKTRQ